MGSKAGWTAEPVAITFKFLMHRRLLCSFYPPPYFFSIILSFCSNLLSQQMVNGNWKKVWMFFECKIRNLDLFCFNNCYYALINKQTNKGSRRWKFWPSWLYMNTQDEYKHAFMHQTPYRIWQPSLPWGKMNFKVG